MFYGTVLRIVSVTITTLQSTGDALHQNICALHNPAVTITTLDLCLAQPCMQNTKRELKVSACVLSGMVSVND